MVGTNVTQIGEVMSLKSIFILDPSPLAIICSVRIVPTPSLRAGKGMGMGSIKNNKSLMNYKHPYLLSLRITLQRDEAIPNPMVIHGWRWLRSVPPDK